MKKDFLWLRKVILNNDNKLIHYDSLVRLIELFTIKWKDRKDNLIFVVISLSKMSKQNLKNAYFSLNT